MLWMVWLCRLRLRSRWRLLLFLLPLDLKLAVVLLVLNKLLLEFSLLLVLSKMAPNFFGQGLRIYPVIERSRTAMRGGCARLQLLVLPTLRFAHAANAMLRVDLGLVALPPQLAWLGRRKARAANRCTRRAVRFVVHDGEAVLGF